MREREMSGWGGLRGLSMGGLEGGDIPLMIEFRDLLPIVEIIKDCWTSFTCFEGLIGLLMKPHKKKRKKLKMVRLSKARSILCFFWFLFFFGGPLMGIGRAMTKMKDVIWIHLEECRYTPKER